MPNAAILGRWVNAIDLGVGDVQFTRDGCRVPATNVSVRHAEIKVYNLRVAELENHAVGHSGILVHNTSGQSQPPLQRIHPDTTYQSGTAKLALQHWRKQPTDAIVRSLAPGGREALRVKPDGRVMNGNTRIKVLEERGFDVNSLPREIVP